MVKKYVQVRFPKAAYKDLLMKQVKMQQTVKLLTGKDVRIPLTKIIKLIAKYPIRLPDTEILTLMRRKKK